MQELTWRLSAGGATQFPSSNLALLSEGIIVTINYRVGVFGFLVLPELIQENAVLNYGLQDQQKALEWIQLNIASFGGNSTPPHGFLFFLIWIPFQKKVILGMWWSLENQQEEVVWQCICSWNQVGVFIARWVQHSEPLCETNSHSPVEGSCSESGPLDLPDARPGFAVRPNLCVGGPTMQSIIIGSFLLEESEKLYVVGYMVYLKQRSQNHSMHRWETASELPPLSPFLKVTFSIP